jgi:hypothetical protein
MTMAETTTQPATCTHPKCVPHFNEDDAKAMKNWREVRKAFPRFEGKCPDCGVQLIAYASYAHYVYGDW